jgi:hypothetical protein
LSLSTAAVSLATVSFSFAISPPVACAVGVVVVGADIGASGLGGSLDGADGTIDVPVITNHNTNTNAVAAITFKTPSMVALHHPPRARY